MLIRIFIDPLWSTLNLKTKQASRTKLQDDITKYKKQRDLVVKFQVTLKAFENSEIKKIKKTSNKSMK